MFGKLKGEYSLNKILTEILLIFIGITMALAFDDWNENRLEQTEEAEAISRLIDDIQGDLNDFDSRINGIIEKESSLLRVKTALSEGLSSDFQSFLKDIITGANYGWNQGLARRSTFDDLIGSGKLKIITSPSIRLKIAGYYRTNGESHIRIDERETIYPHLSYQLVPRAVDTLDNKDVEGEFELESGLSELQLRELVSEVQKSSIKNYLIGEINLARFIHRMTLDLQSQAKELIKLLEAYQKDKQ